MEGDSFSFCLPKSFRPVFASGTAQDCCDLVELVNGVVSREQGAEIEEFYSHTSQCEDVHGGGGVPHAQEVLGSPIPPGGNIICGGEIVFLGQPEVNKFN